HMDNAQSLADAQDLIEQAQRDVDQALSDLQQAPPGLLEALLQQQKQIASSLGQLSQNSPNLPSVNQAGQSANQAAQNLSQVNLPQAINSTKSSARAMPHALQSNKQTPAQRNENGEASASLPVLSQQQTEAQNAT